jgi:hypothetical protein
MKTKHKSCKATTRSGRKCSRLGHCEKENMCTQHHNISKEHSSLKHSSLKKSIKPKVYIYHILDNSGHPFEVKVSEDNTVSIYENKDSEEDSYSSYKEEPFKTYKPEKIFIGKSILNKMTEFSGARDNPKWDGNSILLELNSKKLEYLYIGYEIYSFKAYTKIVEYVSPVGNSGVPYPYAIDELGNYYLMIEEIVLENNDKIKKAIQDKSNVKVRKNPKGLKIKTPEFPFDPYTYYYDNTEMHGFENYEGLKIGNQKYFFAFNIEDLDAKKKRFDNAEVILIKKDGSEEVMNKESYKGLMDRFAKSKGFKNFINKVMVHERL